MTREYEIEALTAVWTDGADTDQLMQANRLIATGLCGSMRWWFEVLVQGLCGAPRDPPTNQRACKNKEHCVVCELFGCTGRATIRWSIEADALWRAGAP